MSAFIYKRRIAFHETDAAGVVYFANYFRLAEEAETQPQLEMRPSSNAPNPVECREAPPTSSFPDFSEPP